MRLLTGRHAGALCRRALSRMPERCAALGSLIRKSLYARVTEGGGECQTGYGHSSPPTIQIVTFLGPLCLRPNECQHYHCGSPRGRMHPVPVKGASRAISHSTINGAKSLRNFWPECSIACREKRAPARQAGARFVTQSGGYSYSDRLL